MITVLEAHSLMLGGLLQVKAGCEVVAGQARRAGHGRASHRTPVARLDTPADHGAFFRGEQANFASGDVSPMFCYSLGVTLTFLLVVVTKCLLH